MEPLLSKVEAEKSSQALAIFSALSNPLRLAIVKLLGEADKMTVTEIYQALDMTQAVTSNYLNLLKDKGVLTSVRDKQKIYYSLAIPKVIEMISYLESVGLDS